MSEKIRKVEENVSSIRGCSCSLMDEKDTHKRNEFVKDEEMSLKL